MITKGEPGAPDPIPVRFRVRPEVVTLACIAWMSVPFLVLFVYLAVPWHWLAFVGLPFLLTFPVPLLAVLWVSAPGSARRFGDWLERHVGDPVIFPREFSLTVPVQVSAVLMS